MKWGLIVTSNAKRDLRTIPRSDLERIDDALEAIIEDPYGGDVKFLRGGARTVRRRAGDWRIIYEVHAKKRLAVVLTVVRRASNTY